MSHPRFYTTQIPNVGQVDLNPEDARHACSVLRLRIGDRVSLFDGQGNESAGEIVRCGKSAVTVQVDALQRLSRELSSQLLLFVSLPKGDRQKQLVDVLVQLGVHAMTPLVCQRSVAQPTDNTLERLQRTVIESSKQCGRNQLMLILPPVSLQQLASSHSSWNVAGAGIETPPLRLFAHPIGADKSLLAALQPAIKNQLTSAAIAIGPEGGLTEQESAHLASNGWQQVHLGRRILRVETAAIFAAATWAAWQERNGGS